MDKPAYDPNERRPIATRDLKASQTIAAWLATHGISPNAISIFGMLAAIVGGVALASTHLVPEWARWLWLSGAAGAQLRLAANMFDGMVAIATGKAFRTGELYNEVPDRISDAALLIGLGYASGAIPMLGYLAALAALFTAYVRAQCRVAGAPQDFCGPMAKPQRMFWLTVTAIYCTVTPAAWQPHDILGSGGGLPAVALAAIFLGSGVTAVRRLWHAAQSLNKQT
jgi:phosphatidylglycerophosphate synthase